jgi:hypothetical protein
MIKRRRWLFSAFSMAGGFAIGGQLGAADESYYDLASLRTDLVQLEKQWGPPWGGIS